MATLDYARAARHIGEALGGITAVLCATYLAWLASSHTWLEVLVIAWSIPPFYVAFVIGGILGESAYEKLHHSNLNNNDGSMNLDELQVHRTK